jgi:hypothetical protein
MKIGNIEYLNPQEFAEAKGCSLKTVYNWINAGEDSDGYKIVVEDILKKTMINIDTYQGKLKS